MSTLKGRVEAWYAEDQSRYGLEALDALEAFLSTEPTTTKRASAARTMRLVRQKAAGALPPPVAFAPPSMVLADDDDTPQGVESVDMGASDKGDSFSIDWDRREYVFDFRGQVWTAPFGEVAKWCWWYPDQGERHTARAVAMRADEEHKRDLTEDWARRALWVLGVKKSSPPFAPHELQRHTPDEIAKLAHQRRQNAAERALRRDETRQWRDIARKALREARDLDRIVSELVDALKRHKRANIPRIDLPTQRDTLAVFALFDAHFGKRGVNGRGLDTSIARVIDTGRVLARNVLRMGKPERVELVFGGDTFHVDNTNNSTTRGTPQDVDRSAPEILRAGILASIDYVDMLRPLGHVTVKVIPGNHDEIMSFALLNALERHYLGVDGVEVTVHARTRLYTTHGSSLLMYEHGDGPKPKDLGAIMAREKRREWGNSLYRYALTGHLHHVHEHDLGGVTVLQAPSPATLDAWHEKHGYVLADAAMRAHIFDAQDGLIASVRAPVKP